MEMLTIYIYLIIYMFFLFYCHSATNRLKRPVYRGFGGGRCLFTYTLLSPYCHQ